jgi:tetratricopeptide (TPR) repeat protein
MNFIGREKVVAELLELLLSSPVTERLSALYLIGEPGIGKTALAYHLYDSDEVKREYRNRICVSAYNLEWGTVIRRIAHNILGDLPVKAVQKELEEKIIAYVRGQHYLVFIDNVDRTIEPELLAFVDAWRGASPSVLLLTAQRRPGQQPDRCRFAEIPGLEADSVVDLLLGETMSERLKTFGLRDHIKTLKGNPQKIRYLRWTDPKSEREIEKCIKDLDNPDAGQDAVRKILNRIGRKAADSSRTREDPGVPLKHFLAIANVRNPSFDEALLAFLWDRLGSGSTELYTIVRKCLIEEGVLEVPESGRLRLNATVHSQLWQPFALGIPKTHQGHVQYFIGDYFRKRFIARIAQRHSPLGAREGDHNEADVFPIEDLESYVYHTVEAGHVESVYSFLFDRGIVEQIHAAGLSVVELLHAHGLSLDLKALLEQMNKAVQSKLYPVVSCGDSERRELLKSLSREIDQWLTPHKAKALSVDLSIALSRIKHRLRYEIEASPSPSSSLNKLKLVAADIEAELGRTYKDLNVHNDALKHLKKANSFLEPLLDDDRLGNKTHRLRADIAHFLGIVYSVTGQTRECLETYFDGLKAASAHGCKTARDALTMGYLAYELKFHNIDLALHVADGAVKAAEIYGDKTIIAKNLCSLGQIQSFIGLNKESDSSFKAAADAGSDDVREQCRIQVNWAVTDISERRFDAALKKLEKVESEFGTTGDRRRVWMAMAYQGIVAYHRGERDAASKLVQEAMERHKSIGTEREKIYEAMSYVWIVSDQKLPSCDGNFAVEFPKIEKMGLPESVREVLANAKEDEDRLGIFVDFWKKHYCPTLLTLRGQALG